jgi:DNA-binding transcriptional MerR regulator
LSESFSIAALAREFKVTARAIRFYEDKGLLAPLRVGQTRVYSRRERGRLALVLRGRRLGFKLAEIKEMLDLYEVGDGQVAQMQLMLRRVRERLEGLEGQRRDILEAISELKDVASSIESFLAGERAKDTGSIAAE